jgi:hypothetical protein
MGREDGKNEQQEGNAEREKEQDGGKASRDLEE